MGSVHVGRPPRQLQALPYISGPIIYAVPEGNGWHYVGQTNQSLRARLAGHLRDPYRANRWAAVMTLELVDTVSPARLNALERTGQQLLRPRTGHRWPVAG